MNCAAKVLAVFCVLACGCGPKFQEKDLNGDWLVDNATIPKSANAQNMAGSTLTLLFDHSFHMAFAPVTLKGTWSYAEGRLKITPETLVMSVQGKPLEFKVSELADKFGPILSNTPEGQKELEGLQSAGKPWDLKVADDGKSLSSAEGLTWRKA